MPMATVGLLIQSAVRRWEPCLRLDDYLFMTSFTFSAGCKLAPVSLLLRPPIQSTNPLTAPIR